MDLNVFANGLFTIMDANRMRHMRGSPRVFNGAFVQVFIGNDPFLDSRYATLDTGRKK